MVCAVVSLKPYAAWLVVCLALHLVPVMAYTDPRCNSDPKYREALEMDFDTVGNKTVWGVCNYPDPRDNYEMCGRRTKSWLCDPDGLLTTEEADELENLLNTSYARTVCRCKEDCTPEYQGNPILLLLLDELRVPDLTGTVCTGGRCGELYPQINPTGRVPSSPEQQQAVDDFSLSVLRRWRLGECSDGIVIVYWAKYKWLSVSAGELALDLIEEKLESSQTHALIHIEAGRVSQGLASLVGEYVTILEHRKRWPFYLGVTLSVIAGIVIIFGLVMTVKFCQKEFQQGKTCCQVWHSCVGGEDAVLLGGNKPRMVPAVYEQTKPNDPML